MTQQNAALVEQAAAAAASLHEQTVNLARAVSIFRIEPGQDRPAAAQADVATVPLERRAPGSPMRGRPAVRRAPEGADTPQGTARSRHVTNG